MNPTATYPPQTPRYDNGGYRYFFNGQEADNEVLGEGVSLTAEFWQYDSRLGRRWNVDPKPQTGISLYSCFNNNPMWFVDVNGDTVESEICQKALTSLPLRYCCMKKTSTKLDNLIWRTSYNMQKNQNTDE